MKISLFIIACISFYIPMQAGKSKVSHLGRNIVMQSMHRNRNLQRAQENQARKNA